MLGGQWDYDEEGRCGPRHWPNADSASQSPIDIEMSKVKYVGNVNALQFLNYDRPVRGYITNNGHSVQVTLEGADLPEISGGDLDQVYRLVQYHFHWASSDTEGSEHTVAGLHYPAELHLVHEGVTNSKKIAVIAVFLVLAKSGDAFQKECDLIDNILYPPKKAPIDNVNVEAKLPKTRDSFWRYTGSLTTPPCTEVVTWTVFTEPVPITHQQISCFRKICDQSGHQLRRNYRPVQKLNDREVLHMKTR